MKAVSNQDVILCSGGPIEMNPGGPVIGLALAAR
jgi:hypothetical protein